MNTRNDDRAAILKREMDALFAQPSKRTIKHQEAVNVIAKLDGRRNDNVLAKTQEPAATVACHTGNTKELSAALEAACAALGVTGPAIAWLSASYDSDHDNHDDEIMIQSGGTTYAFHANICCGQTEKALAVADCFAFAGAAGTRWNTSNVAAAERRALGLGIATLMGEAASQAAIRAMEFGYEYQDDKRECHDLMISFDAESGRITNVENAEDVEYVQPANSNIVATPSQAVAEPAPSADRIVAWRALRALADESGMANPLLLIDVDVFHKREIIIRMIESSNGPMRIDIIGLDDAMLGTPVRSPCGMNITQELTKGLTSLRQDFDDGDHEGSSRVWIPGTKDEVELAVSLGDRPGTFAREAPILSVACGGRGYDSKILSKGWNKSKTFDTGWVD